MIGSVFDHFILLPGVEHFFSFNAVVFMTSNHEIYFII